MGHLYSVTKSFDGLPTAHCQFQDICEDGSPGACAALHGYDRIVTIKVSAGELDEYGWVFPFGAFKNIRSWLEYYFDHTSVFPANDPRLDSIKEARESGIIGTARLLPYGVSMEMSALFLYEHANRYVYEQSGGRAAITHIEFREHHKNAGEINVDYLTSMANARLMEGWPQLVKQSDWKFVSPKIASERILEAGVV
jgi:6-pyruvoyl-tetrahydropterin synthase